MDRYQTFHNIITKANVASRHDIITRYIDSVVSDLRCDRGMFFSGSAGKHRCESAQGPRGVKLEFSPKEVPTDLLNKCFNTGSVITERIPIVPESAKASTSSWGRIKIKHILVIPAFAGKRDGKPVTTGIVYLERSLKLPSFQEREILFARYLIRDISHLIQSSAVYEAQTYQIHQLKEEVVQKRIGMVSDHPSMLKLFRKINKLAKVPSTVLITGESGTGKELVARAIYNLSELRGPFISINCGGIEPNLMKSELFGHKKGSFTGAQSDRDGLFKKAEGGILFLDELAEMPMDIQVLLLRTLQLGEILPVGSDLPEIVHTRVVAATHRDLREMVEKGTFRNDLYQRLKGISLEVPPLRKRKTDIEPLMHFFLDKYNNKLGTNFKNFSAKAKEKLLLYDYEQGNVRELEHLIERAMVFEDDTIEVGIDNLLFEGESSHHVGKFNSPFEERMAAFGRKLILDAIAKSGENKTKAMKSLGLPRTTFYSLLHKYNIK
ncbi:MAG: hypothetical protein CR997_01780 [Acidobacteria bacterium]|nr:MAG: hypothetical protein CR997_01780 [Acidobacteriota bacterium]